MPIQYKGRDISNIVKSGSNIRTQNIPSIKDAPDYIEGAPYGEKPTLSWENPNSFGITVGGKDLSTYYKANYVDYTNSVTDITIPEGVNMLKVFCIGAGGGGSGGNGGHRNWNRETGYCYGPNMNRNFNWNDAYCDHYTRYDDPANGNIGAYGEFGKYEYGEFPREGNTYRIQLGYGGQGGSGGNYQEGGSGNSGNDGNAGNATEFIMGRQTLLANGGAGGPGTNSNQEKVQKALEFPKDKPEHTVTAGTPGLTSTESGFSGNTGHSGFCRVYYLY